MTMTLKMKLTVITRNKLTELLHSYVPSFENQDHQRSICKTLELPYPTLDNHPVDEFRTEGYIICAFPSLFAHGTADIRAPRDVTITLRECFQYLMYYKDGRFARDPRFRFFAMDTLLRKQALSQASYFTNKPEIAALSISELESSILNDSKFFNHVMPYVANVRSTRPYWNQRTSEILTMTEQLGCPTVFFTLSAADYYWPGLYRLITGLPDVSHLNAKDRQNLIHRSYRKFNIRYLVSSIIIIVENGNLEARRMCTDCYGSKMPLNFSLRIYQIYKKTYYAYTLRNFASQLIRI